MTDAEDIAWNNRCLCSLCEDRRSKGRVGFDGVPPKGYKPPVCQFCGNNTIGEVEYKSPVSILGGSFGGKGIVECMRGKGCRKSKTVNDSGV